MNKKRIFIYFINLIIMSVIVYSQNIPLKVTPLTYHLGKIPDNKIAKCYFTLFNISNKPIKILNIQTTCGCTVAKLPKKILFPKERTKLEIRFNPRGRKGYNKWEIGICTDLKRFPKIIVSFDAYILKEGLLSTNFISFGEFRKGVICKKRLWIAPKDFPNFKIKKIELKLNNNIKEKCFDILYNKGIYKGFFPGPRNGYYIDVITRKDIPYGKIEGKLIIFTNIPKKERIEIPILAKVAGEIGITEYNIKAYIPPYFNRFLRKIRVYNREGKNFNILKVSTNIKFLKVNIKTIIPNQYYEVIIKNKKAIPFGESKGVLFIKTDNKKQKIIKIPIRIIHISLKDIKKKKR